jgi:hypothetical protein
MYPEDRVLVAYVPRKSDFEIVKSEQWYRIPEKHAPKGIHAEYLAFYFGRNFGQQKWAIHYYASRRGLELVRRIDLFPEQWDHPRAQEPYYKIILGPLQRLEEPILSLRWRRITFMHTTWDRFQDAREINDLFIVGDKYVDRLYAALKERGIQPERRYRVEEPGASYEVELAVFTRDGRIDIRGKKLPNSDDEVSVLADQIERELASQAEQH